MVGVPSPNRPAAGLGAVHAALLAKLKELSRQHTSARARGDRAGEARAYGDMAAIRRAARVLECPLPTTTAQPRSIHDVILSTLLAASAPLGFNELLAGLEREQPQTVRGIRRNSVWVALYRLEKQGLIHGRGERGRRVWVPAPQRKGREE
jgi:hypothetical protein